MRITYKYVFYNPITNEVGIPIVINGFYLLDIGLITGYKALTNDWIQVGIL